MASKGDYLLVAALDFGTTYSGYAFSMKHEFKSDPLKIHANQAWNSGGRGMMSLKTPTCLLLNDKKEFVAFGYDAENQYADIAMDGEQDDYYYFHRFKMNLHNNKNITKDMMIEDITGKSVLALDVFSSSIHALVIHLTDILEKQGTGLRKNEIQWVLTVPAIWTDAAKDFMRKSAVKAGIPDDRLLIALEPEAASIFCQYLPTKKLIGSEQGFTMTEDGTKYMIIDLGGGTADITVHKKVGADHLSELYRATGNDCGGTSVDSQFFQMLIKIFGGPLMTSLKEEDPAAYIDLLREFETVKRTIKPIHSGKVNVTIPYASLDGMCQKYLGENLVSVLSSSTFSDRIILRGDKMRIDVELMTSLFEPSITKILSLLKEIASDKAVSGLSTLLLVGGFSECLLIQDAVRRNFPNKKIIIPEETGLSVLKGAVLFGHKPDYVMSRVMRFTYGIDTQQDFNPEHHDRSRLKLVNGKEKCYNVFQKLVTKHESVSRGMKISKEYLAERSDNLVEFKLVTSAKEDPKYTDDASCNVVGSTSLSVEPSESDRQWIDVDYVFGNTELSFLAKVRKTGKELKTTFTVI